MRPCYLYDGNSYTGKTPSFYWIANTPRTCDVEIILIIRKMDSLNDSNHFDIPGLHLCETVLEFSAYLKLILAMRPGFLKILKIFFHINPSFLPGSWSLHLIKYAPNSPQVILIGAFCVLC